MEPHDPSSTSASGSGRRPGQFEPVPFGKYFLLDRIAVGGMAEIFRARTYGHAGFEKELVIKRILSHLTDNEDFVTMFIDEAKLTVQLTHPNIVQVYDFGKSRDHFFLAMEGIYGKDLKTIGKKLEDKRQQIPMQFASYVAHEAAKGLYYAHSKRDERGQELHIVHRDISPSNLIVSYDGQVKLLDFGIAKAESSAIEDTEGVLKGKFEYMSPEQAAGQIVDNRSDIFSLGICLWEMVTGRRLFKSEKKLETLERIRAADIPQVRVVNPEIPRELEHIIQKALSKEPRARYQDAEQMRHELEEYLKPTGTNELTLDVSEWMQDLFVLEMEQERLRLESARESAQSLARMEDNLDLDFEPDDDEDTIETDEEAQRAAGVSAPAGSTPPVAAEARQDSKKIPGLVWVALVVLVLATGIGGVALMAVMNGGGGGGDDDDATVTTPQFGALDVQVLPEAAAGATIMLDGKPVEPPVTDLEPGREYTLKVTRQGFLDHEETFKVAAGEQIRIRATLLEEGEEPTEVADVATPTPSEPATPADLGPGVIIFKSSPSGAQVVLNGSSVGASPYRFTNGTPGRRYTATFKLDGYEDASASGTFPSEGQITAQASLAKKAAATAQATISINAKPWATIYLDGKKIGNTPKSGVMVDAGAHVVRLVCPPLDAEKTIPFTVSAGEEKSISADLEE